MTNTVISHYLEDYLLFGIKAPLWAVSSLGTPPLADREKNILPDNDFFVVHVLFHCRVIFENHVPAHFYQVCSLLQTVTIMILVRKVK